MALTAADVAHLADLARIDLTKEERARMAGELDIILDAVASVSAAVTPDIRPTSHALALTNVFRADVVGESLPASAVLAGGPAVEESRFRVPRILQETT